LRDQLLLKKEFDRWTADVSLVVGSKFSLKTSITVRDNVGKPDSKGMESVQYFVENFDFFWNVFIDAFHESNNSISFDDLYKSVDKHIYLFSPSLVGSIWYELIALIDLQSDLVPKKSYMFCFNGNQLVNLEVFE
jgi:hypothetical protein